MNTSKKTKGESKDSVVCFCMFRNLESSVWFLWFRILQLTLLTEYLLAWEIYFVSLLKMLTEGEKKIKVPAKEMLNIVCDNISLMVCSTNKVLI